MISAMRAMATPDTFCLLASIRTHQMWLPVKQDFFELAIS